VLTRKRRSPGNGGSLEKVGSLVKGALLGKEGSLGKKGLPGNGSHWEMEGHQEMWGLP